jgi:hypothetical protein
MSDVACKEVRILVAEVEHQFVIDKDDKAVPVKPVDARINALRKQRDIIEQAESVYSDDKVKLTREIEHLRSDPRLSKAISPDEASREGLKKELKRKQKKRVKRCSDYDAEYASLRGDFNRQLGRLNRTALCLSGGGIRSGAFALGVLQALATYPRQKSRDPSEPDEALLGQMDFLSTVSGGGYIGGWLSAWITRSKFQDVQSKLVARPLPSQEPREIEYLRRYSNFLTPKLGVLSADSWAAIALYFRNLFLNWLIIIPAICLPLLFLKMFAAAAGFFARQFASGTWPHIIQAILAWIALALAVAGMIYALRNVTINRPTYAERGIKQRKFLCFVLIPIVFAAICWCGFILSPAFSDFLKKIGPSLQEIARQSEVTPWLKVGCLTIGAVIGLLIYAAGWLLARPRHRLRYFMQRPKSPQEKHPDLMEPWSQVCRDGLQFAAGGVIYGLLAGLGVYLWLLSPHMIAVPVSETCKTPAALAVEVTPTGCQLQFSLAPAIGDAACKAPTCGNPLTASDASSPSAVSATALSADATNADPEGLAWKARLFVMVALGLPWLIFAQLTGEAVFTGLASFAKHSDSDREWLGRAAGWYLLTAIGWVVTVVLIYGGSTWLLSTTKNNTHWLDYVGWVGGLKSAVSAIGDYLAPVGGISAIATALLSGSSLTGGEDKSKGKASSISRLVAENGLSIAAFIFLVSLVVFLAIGLDWILLGESLFESGLLQLDAGKDWFRDAAWLVAGFVIALILMLLASSRININRFSLHALYRNRLVREFLGATNLNRNPNRFTDFAIRDNLEMHKLREADVTVGGRRRLFHVVNMTLNLVATTNLAWQERQGESFTVSPLHSGAAPLGYRDSKHYAKGEAGGITLGTAMAISGAAASPNMGYHSSPLITLIMTLLNVRLGWWLGNPKNPQAAKLDGPSSAIAWMLSEAFGLTTDKKDFIYLSDGGHFENLGLYEMVRRRCRYIIVSDAGCDPTCALEDLGNAVRKIEIDLGVRITFRDLQKLKPRLSVEDAQAGKTQEGQECWCVGRIGYREADYKDGGGENADGYLIYIKPSFRGVESAGVRAYALAHAEFPHESTADQWFGESQFESYRKLGFDIAEELLKKAMAEISKRGISTVPTIEDFFEALAG